MTEMTIDGHLPVLDLQYIDGMIAAHVDTSIGDGCHHYQFETGDDVTVQAQGETFDGVISSVQIEHGLTLWIKAEGDDD